MTWIKGLSIKHKLILAFSGIFLMMMLLLVGLNRGLTDDFFIANNFRVISERVAVNIENYGIDSRGDYDKEAFVSIMKKETGSEASLIFPDGSTNRMPKSSEEELEYVRTYYNHLLESVSEPGEVVSKLIGEGKYTDRRLLYVQVLPGGEKLVVTKMMGFVMEAQELFISFLMLSGLMVYLISIVLVVIYADRFTKPIREVEQAAYRISQLNFKDRLDESRKDEIGSLNHHINAMSTELSSTIQAYNDSNQKLMAELNKERNMEAMREQFVSDVSHELKNPISMIIGYAEGLNRGLAKTDEDRAFYNRVIIEEGERMNVLVEELLDLSSYRSGAITLDREDFCLSDMIKKTADRYKMTQKEKSVDLSLEVAEDVYIHADSVRMGQVVNNLLDNAFKYCNEGGSVRITITDEGPEGRPSLTVSNTGALISEEEFDNIWNSFYQIDTEHRGSGLGLAIVKSIVELHQYTIEGFTEGGMNHFKVIFR